MTNFKVKFINQFFQDVINDYEKSIIGTFTKSLLEAINSDLDLKPKIQVYFTITKFDNDYGFSLIHQDTHQVDSCENSQQEGEVPLINSNQKIDFIDEA